MIIIGIIVAIIMFSVVVLIHEFWHFSAARKFWVKVEEFWLGIPPRAKKLFTDKKWTLFSLNWLPLWWFVRLKWENPHLLENKDDPEALVNKTYIQQSIILLGWVFMNFVLAIIIFSILFFVWVQPIWINDRIKTDLNLKIIPTYEQALELGILKKWEWIILQPVKDSPAETAWIEVWDIVTHINNSPVSNPEDLMDIVSNNKNNSLLFSVLRKNPCPECPKESICKPCKWDEKLEILIPVSPEWKIWSYIWDNITLNKDFEYKYWMLESLKYGTLETFNQSLLTFKAIWTLFRKVTIPETPQERTQAISEMKWPIWIVDLVANSLSAWVTFIVIIWAIISINLWVFNLLPIPALDGWRFVLISLNTLVRKIFWKKAITENTENMVHVFFFIILIALSVIIWYNDIVNIFNR